MQQYNGQKADSAASETACEPARATKVRSSKTSFVLTVYLLFGERDL
jgi:hypothetical protein